MNFDDYKNTKPYPSKKDFTKTYFYLRGKLIATRTAAGLEIEPGCKDISLEKTVKENEIDEAAYKQAQREYGEESARLEAQFYADVKKDLGIENNPKADKLLGKAYEMGHSGGWSEVYNVALDLVDLIL